MNSIEGKKAVVLGGESGLLGQALVEELRKVGVKISATCRSSLDPMNPEALSAFLEREEPDMVFNTVAHTQVDAAEEEADESRRLNTSLPERLGRLSARLGFLLVHFSTDFVFDGQQERAYTEEDSTNPLSVYGKTKHKGECKLLEMDLDRVLIIRSAWLFGPGRDNFVSKILRLARDRDALSVVHDQTGSPTYTPDLARYTLQLVESGASGLFHIVNSGQATWCELAAEAIKVAGLTCRVEAVGTEDYPTKATRPAYSQLNTEKFSQATGMTPRPWAQALRDYVYTDLADEFPEE
ncbi:MAG: dTDP-4-dehydrorhamnose reductase [Desulfovibrio sp.]|jgi:dTDP-4-dehydrorhamnose reductase|nr:dTDP-4-dehydrorhamnose reductase [Desulfovibrio sp.]